MKSTPISYISLSDTRMLEDSKNVTVLNLLRDADQEVLHFIAGAKPLGLVRLTTITLSRDKSRSYTRRTREQLLDELPIFDLTPIGRTMVIGVGRYPANHLRPRCLVNRDSHTHVSREHGVIFVKNGELKYRDLGTYRSGSTNGTTINGKNRFHNDTITWAHDDILGIGGMVASVLGIPDAQGDMYRLRFVSGEFGDDLPHTRLV